MRKRITRIATAFMVVAAFGAAAASAAQAHEWTIKGESLVKRELASESLSFSKASNFKFAFRAAEVNWKWTCAPTFEEGSIAQGGKGHIQIGFSSCAWEMSFGQCGMHPLTNLTLRTELIEAGGLLFLKFLPNEKSGETLFRFQVGGDPGCTLNTEWVVQGNFAGLISAAKTSQSEHALEFSPSIDKAAGSNLHVGTAKAEMTGGFTNALSGKFLGAGWAAE